MEGFKKGTFSENGINIAYASVPEDFQLKGHITNEWQHDLVPFSTNVQAVSPDKQIILFSSGRELYEDYLNSFQRNLIARSPGCLTKALRSYTEPDQFMKEYAENLVRSRCRLISKSPLASFYGNNKEHFAKEQMQYFRSHSININVQIEPSSQCVDAILECFDTTVNGTTLNIMVGMDFRGIEYYDALAMNPFSGFFPFANQQRPANNNIKAVFGHGKEAGKRVDVIEWGAERMYACIYIPERMADALTCFKNFVSSFKSDENITAQANRMIEERFNASYRQAVQMANSARQMQMNSAIFQQQTARNISNQMNSISDGIMDSWNQKMASDSRISNNFSQATRGVNTYTGNNGQSFEFSNQADHVYTNQYGDHVGVSGNGLDQETLNNLNWTEAFKK